MISSSRISLLIVVSLFPFLTTAQQANTARELPLNMGGGLRELVELHRSRPAGMLHLGLKARTVAIDRATGQPSLVPSSGPSIVSDRQGRVLATLVLDRMASRETMRKALTKLGASVVAEDEYQPELVAIFLPLDSAVALAELDGVSAIKLSRRPIHNAGAVTSQGVQIIHSDQANAAGVTGQGITIGIISDSFDGVSVKPTSSDDVSTGDLPNMGVAEGRPGLKFLSDGAGEDFGDTDEGRAMAQVAFDVAPQSSLCFASADFGSIGFAKSVRRLRTDPSCGADVIVDDIQYLDEPMFSDGAIAKAIDDVVTSDTLAGRKVAYFSAAGNAGQAGYASNLRFVADADARAILNGGVDLTTIPARIDTAGGFHNFNIDSNSAPAIYQSVTVTGSDVTTLVLQWDDLFDAQPSGVTTDLNLLVFDGRGRYVGSSSDNNFRTNEPIESIDLPSDTYRIVISRTGTGSHLSTQLRYVAFVASDGAFSGDYLTRPQPTVYGHAASRNAQAVGAYVFDTGVSASGFRPGLEYFSSAGPVTISFDAAGRRLAAPETRRKPDFAAPDCVNTTFFFEANVDDPFFTFCGTSAAAPHAAAAAALLLQAAGGSGSLSNERIRGKLQSSTDIRDLDPFFSQAVLTSGAATVTVTATGDDTSSALTSFFLIAFQSSTSGQSLTGLTIDLGPAGLNFDPSARTGFPFTVGTSSTGIVVTSPAPASRNTVLSLTFNGFVSSGFLTFGIDRDASINNGGGNSADLLAGAKVTAVFSSGTPASGVFANQMGTGFSPFDGFGLINVATALTVP